MRRRSWYNFIALQLSPQGRGKDHLGGGQADPYKEVLEALLDQASTSLMLQTKKKSTSGRRGE
jgi:hypothetical protein